MLLGKLVPFVAINQVIFFRILELLTRTTGAIVLAAGVWHWTSKYFNEVRSIYALTVFSLFSVIGALLVFSSNFPQTISYNGLAAFLSFTSAGLLFYAFSDRSATTNKPSSFFIALYFAGFLTGLEFFAKFSSAVLFLALSLLFTGIVARRIWLKIMPIYLFGVLSAAGIYFAAFEKPEFWYKNFVDAWLIQSSSTSHGIKFVLWTYAQSLIRYAKFLPLIAAAYLLVNLYFKSAISPRSRRVITVAVVTGLVASTAYYLSNQVYSCGRDSFYFLALILFNIFVLAASHKKADGARFTSSNVEVTSGLLALASLPILASVGTNCDLLQHAASNQAPWFVLLALLTILVAARLKSSLYFPVVMAAAVVVSIFQFMDGYVMRPYDLHSSLLSQTETVNCSDTLKGIQVNPRLKAYLEHTYSILKNNGFQQGDPLLALYEMPGVVYALSATSPGQAWYINWCDYEDINGHYLRQIANKPSRLFLMVAQTDPPGSLPETTQEALKSVGMEFPKMFDKIGEVDHPHDSSKVFLYSLRNPTAAQLQPSR